MVEVHDELARILSVALGWNKEWLLVSYRDECQREERPRCHTKDDIHNGCNHDEALYLQSQ